MTNTDAKPDAAAEQRALTRELRRQELAEMKFDPQLQGGSLMKPLDGKHLLDMANMMAGSGFMVRDIYRDNPGACAGLIMVCAPYGLNPFQVSWKTYKASKSDDAPIAYEAQLVMAMINIGAPIKGKLRPAYSGSGATLKCTITGFAAETGQELVYESPEVGQIKVKNSPLWVSDPQQQLFYYSARAWCRRYFPEILLGIYTPDEIDVDRPEPTRREPKDVTPEAQRLADRVKQARAPVEAAGAPVEADVADAEVIPPEAEGGAVRAADEADEADAAFDKWREERDGGGDGDLFGGKP